MRAYASLAGLALAAQVGCASAVNPSLRPPTPAEIADLEARALRDSTDTEAQLKLALAYRGQGRPRAALPVAERALRHSPDHARAALLVALTHEELGNYPDARAVYERAMRTTRSPRLRAQLQARLVLLQRRDNEQLVKRALAREAELAAAPPRPRTLAVYPFGAAAADSALAPLARALTAMLIADLSQTDRITVLDRVVVQLLLDEIRLGESGRVDEATAARGGRLLGAERLVQGSIAGEEKLLTLEAAVISAGGVATPPPAGNPPVNRPPTVPEQKAAPPPLPRTVAVTESGRLDALFDTEKRLALRLYSALGIELTPAERVEVTRRRTENLQAFLAYGRGLQATDRGELDAALRFFSQAARLDPGFAPAARELSATRAIVTAEGMSTEQLATQVTPTTAVPAGMPPAAGAVQRDPIAEVLGTEGVVTRTILELVLRRPGGAP